VGATVPQVYRVRVGALEIPFSSIFAHRSPYVLTVSIVCPALPDATVATLLAANDPLSLYFGVQLPSGEQLEPWLSVPLTGITHDQGGRSGAVTLKAVAIPDAHAGRIRSMPRRYTTQTRDGLRTWVGPDGVTDGMLAKKGQNLLFKFIPDKNKAPYQITQGVLGVARTFGVGSNPSATVTVSASQASVDFAS
jgi:hypothetical protein